MPKTLDKQAVDAALEAGARALEDADFTRLPAWMAAKVVVETAAPTWAQHYEDTVVRLRREVAELKEALADQVQGSASRSGL